MKNLSSLFGSRNSVNKIGILLVVN
uniref:Uncharacterized protein n=1 Tax=Tetranychus urticae TaxID=32264 RepID=T1K1S2_TETUR